MTNPNQETKHPHGVTVEPMAPIGGVPVREPEKKASPRHEEPRRPEPERRKEEDAPRGIAEIDIHTGKTIHEEHTEEPETSGIRPENRRPPG